jgi:SRSO17 transposase
MNCLPVRLQHYKAVTCGFLLMSNIERRQMCPLYVSGLIGPGDRKSMQPMAKQLVLAEYDQY